MQLEPRAGKVGDLLCHQQSQAHLHTYHAGITWKNYHLQSREQLYTAIRNVRIPPVWFNLPKVIRSLRIPEDPSHCSSPTPASQ